METNKKTIQINPELFKLNGNTTRKKHSLKNREDKIRIKNQNKLQEKPKKMSTIKKNILKMIRNHQDERRKKKDLDLNLDLNDDIFVGISAIYRLNIIEMYQRTRNILTYRTNK